MSYCVKCGRTIHGRSKDKVTCRPCLTAEHEASVAEFIKADWETHKRSWFKHVCKHGAYDPAIRIRAHVFGCFYRDIQRALVLEINRTINLGMDDFGDRVLFIDGYYRATGVKRIIDGREFFFRDSHAWSGWIEGIALYHGNSRVRKEYISDFERERRKREAIAKRELSERLARQAEEHRLAVERWERREADRAAAAERKARRIEIRAAAERKKHRMAMRDVRRRAGRAMANIETRKFFEVLAASAAIQQYQTK